MKKELGPEYVLVCRKCAAGANMLPYVELMHITTRDSVEKYQLEQEEGVHKRQRTGYECKGLLRKSDQALDIVILKDFVDRVC